MGTSHSVYLANDSGQDLYVIASLSPEWAIIDLVVDAVLLTNGVEELKGAISLSELPATLSSLSDIYNFIKIAVEITLGMFAVGTRPADAAKSLIDAFKKVAVKIPDQNYKGIHDDNVLNYLNADGIAALLGANTVSLLVLSGDGKQLTMWDSGPDNSWIAAGDKSIVRSVYGTIWQKDPFAGTIIWPDISKEFPWGDGNDQLIVGKIYLISIYNTNKVFVADEMHWLRVKPYQSGNQAKYWSETDIQAQYWRCTVDSNNRFGFFNLGFKYYLGRDVYQNLACYASEQREWECLVLTTLSGGGYRLSVHIDDRICPTLLSSDNEGEYMRVVAESDTVIGLNMM